MSTPQTRSTHKISEHGIAIDPVIKPITKSPQKGKSLQKTLLLMKFTAKDAINPYIKITIAYDKQKVNIDFNIFFII